MEASRLPRARLSPVRINWSEISVALVASAAVGYTLTALGNWTLAAAGAAAAMLLVLGLLAVPTFVVVFLVVRPLTDWLSEKELVPGANAAGLLAVLMVLITIVALVGRHSQVRHRPGISVTFAAAIGLSALAAIPALVTYGTQLGTEALAEIVRLVSLLAMYLLARYFFPNVSKIRQLFVVTVVSALIPALIGIVQLALGVGPEGQLDFGRLRGTFFAPTPFAAYLAVAAIILIALPRDALPRLTRIAMIAILMVPLIGTYSRTGWGIFVIGFLLLQLRRRKLVIMFAAVVAALLAINLPGFTSERVVRNQPLEGSGSASAVPSSFSWRLNNWDLLLVKYSESPVVGFGLRTSEVVNPNRTGLKLETATSENPSGRVGYSPHSTLVRSLVEGGPLLLAAWVAVFAALIGRMWQITRDSPELRDYARILFVVWIAMAIAGVTSTDSLNLTVVLFPLFALTGAVAGAADTAGARPEP